MKNKTDKAPALRCEAKVRRAWVVEMWNWNLKRWEPCADAQLTRKDANRVIRDYWCANMPDDAFRAVKYIPSNR